MTSTDERKKIREAIAVRPHRRRRLPRDLRLRAVAYTARRKAEGTTASAIAAELGVSQPTVARWLEMAAESTAALTRVATPRCPPILREVVVETRSARTLSIVSPCGYRVEGLSLDEAAVMLRALG